MLAPDVAAARAQRRAGLGLPVERLPGTQGSFLTAYVGHFWSLAVEEHFYLVWPWVVVASTGGG